MEFTILKLQRKDLSLAKELLTLFNEVFLEEGETVKPLPNDNYLERLLSQTSFHIFVAMADDKVVGGLTAYEMTMYMENSKELYLYDLGVDENFRRKGVATKLIQALLEYGKVNKVSTIFVEANEEDTEAVKFYTATGGKLEKVSHFNYDLKVKEVVEE